jgi:hypothetical protein
VRRALESSGDAVESVAAHNPAPDSGADANRTAYRAAIDAAQRTAFESAVDSAVEPAFESAIDPAIVTAKRTAIITA